LSKLHPSRELVHKVEDFKTVLVQLKPELILAMVVVYVLMDHQPPRILLAAILVVILVLVVALHALHLHKKNKDQGDEVECG
jgi:predicted benzoate:H+ symporter BenE